MKRIKKLELDKIAEEIKKCRECKKGKIGVAVPGEGSSSAEVVFVGEAPGKNESRGGRPFIGRSGKYLRSLVRNIGLSEDEVFITSPVKYLPKRGTPYKKDIIHGRQHLLKQLEVIKPKIIVLLGNVARAALLPDFVSLINHGHGTVIEKDGIKYFVTFHPAAAVRFPKVRTAFEGDFEKLRSLIELPR